MMKKMILAAALALAIASPAAAQKPAEPDGLTVEQALNVANGLSQLVKYESVDKDGKPTFGFYKFSADLRYAIAINIDVGRSVQTRFQNATNELVMQMSEGSGTVPPAKEAAFKLETAKLFAAPSRAGFVRIKRDDLKLEENPIPGPVLSLIIPIVDR